MATSQVECLAFVAGYAVFSYLKKSINCILCRKFLCTEKSLQVNDDMGSQSILIELLDRGSLKYPSSHVLECIKVLLTYLAKLTVIGNNLTTFTLVLPVRNLFNWHGPLWN